MTPKLNHVNIHKQLRFCAWKTQLLHYSQFYLFYRHHTPVSIRGSVSRNSSVASAPPIMRPNESRADREARRKARELGVIPSGYEMMRDHQVPSLELSPSIWSGQSSPVRSRHSNAP